MKDAVSGMLLGPPDTWKNIFEAAFFEKDARKLSQRIQDAQDAVMDHIEDSFQPAGQTERQSLINAMNALRELRRICDIDKTSAATGLADFSDAA
jgi:hypothetical protein